MLIQVKFLTKLAKLTLLTLTVSVSALKFDILHGHVSVLNAKIHFIRISFVDRNQYGVHIVPITITQH